MRKASGLSLLALVLVAATASAALSWDQGDPLVQVKGSLSAPAPSRSRPPSSGGGTPGQFDSYVFAIEWVPAFCEGKPGLPECSNLGGGFGASNLTLHGLWPDKANDSAHSYGYCGVDASIQALDRAPTWCRMPDPGLSDGVMSRLKPAMPGTASCLQNHEWYKHGSCSGYAPDEYFTRAADLVDFVASTGFGRYISSHVGKVVAGSDLRAAFEGDFGAGSGRMVSLTCTKARGQDMLLDVRMRLSQPLGPASQLGKMLLGGGGAGNCPSSFLLDPAASR